MTAFRDAVDTFLCTPKEATGNASWHDARLPPDQETFWNLIVGHQVSAHRLSIRASPHTPWHGFAVLVLFQWQGRDHAIMRLNVDTDDHPHINRGKRPMGIPMQVRGNRIYMWADNRLAFRPGDGRLPFARPLERRQVGFDNAIRHIAGLAQISLASVTLPDYPSRSGLL